MHSWQPIERCGACGESSYDAVGSHAGLDIRRCQGCRTRRFEAVRVATEVYHDGYHEGTSEFGWDYGSEETAPYEMALADGRVRWIEQWLTPGRILDVGGGLGYLAAAAARRGWDATLIEPVAAACARAAEHDGIVVLQGGSECLDGFAGDRRLVAFSHSLEHIPDALDALRQAAAAVEPLGGVYVEVPNFASVARRLQREHWLGWQPGEHVYLFEPATLRSLLERAGLEVVACESYVPSWEGLRPDSWAYFLGLNGLLGRATRTAKRLRRYRLGDLGDDAAQRVVAGEPGAAPVGEMTGVRRLVYGRGLPLLDRVERLTGSGIYLRALARRRL